MRGALQALRIFMTVLAVLGLISGVLFFIVLFGALLGAGLVILAVIGLIWLFVEDLRDTRTPKKPP